MTKPLLEVEDLWVSFPGVDRSIDVVRGISFSIGREKVGIVGESGSGKSMTGRSILKLTPKAAQIKAKKLQFGDVDLLGASERQMRSVRGNKISMILQDPKYSLNPLIRIGDQIMEAYRLHHRVNKQEARQRTLNMLEAVHIRDAERVMNLFPHEISGGMGQRVMIAMMLIPEPDMIIADEPTSALDVTVRRQVLTVLDELVSRSGTGLMFISHDLNLVADFCDRVLVMYAGRIMEDLPAKELHKAQHPYTQALLASLPRLDHPVDMLQVPERDPSWLSGATLSGGQK
ncbi:MULTISPECIES: ABC transporter ATP-binding protein [Pseudochrobactrum]|uniref:Peptide/nickel transport system ATP-binding protein n=1 Tax=Pseudochrobactrum saccharolyticum TaxID=354352 RepID=A0A7W8AKX3_9HYPH|nr:MULTISPECIES: ABC transporter ATP-binding protein [Pseudochrobactrum]MBX8783520.1 ABC transporter ATP-binding protein [Ochrobactrum sp. GRS2]MBX8812917.1 ABC transporter ATP-binding protein [Ochrobactrum sp. MR34]KAB0537233.1 ABC transporter ATP-binding protein [Pseudochrobactrum saccharolyticum]MBB5092292.1 peptide/nickel transport system ATP-binding protein [Pseudochrobactrum saccharolyticum]MDP8252690.1 ABC transporter ATP-binding protein [Pseudochrobactrum saccharolyticum]